MKVDKSKWEVKKLGEVCEILDTKRRPITKSNRESGDYPYYGANGLLDYVKDYIFDGRFLLVGEDGAKWGSNEPTSYIINGKTWVNNHAHILFVHNTLVDVYLCFYLNFKDLNEFISGSIVPKLTQSSLRKIKIPVPPLSEQQAIASELDAIQSLITKYDEQLNDYDNLAKSIFNEMFGDVISNDKGWERKKLSYMCSEVTSSKRIFAKEYVKEGIPFYRSKEVIERSKGLKPSIELFISTERYNEIKKQYGIPQKNDLLISAVGTIGEIWVVNIDEPFYFKDGNLIWIKSDGINNSIYLKYLLKILIAEYKKSMPNGAAYAALTINKLQNMTVYAIPLPLQQAFAARITAIESQKDEVKQQITDLQTLFDSRMQYYFD